VNAVRLPAARNVERSITEPALKEERDMRKEERDVRKGKKERNVSQETSVK
jgi:hypothetical protein